MSALFSRSSENQPSEDTRKQLDESNGSKAASLSKLNTANDGEVSLQCHTNANIKDINVDVDNKDRDADLQQVDKDVEDSNCCVTFAKECRDNVESVLGEISDMISGLNLGRRVRRICSVQTLKDKLPITKWLPKYRYFSLILISFLYFFYK